ncbi:hypothetical protein D3C76_168430 [compost metagenome]
MDLHALFIRWSASYEQAVELQIILSDILKPNEFTVLILNPVCELTSVREIYWDISHICMVEFPDDMNDYDSWFYGSFVLTTSINQIINHFLGYKNIGIQVQSTDTNKYKTRVTDSEIIVAPECCWI